VGLAFLVISFLTAFGICSDTAIAETLFPFALAVDPTLHDRALMVLLLASVQYPLYGIILGVAWMRSRPGKLAFVACLLVMFVGHVAAVRLANQRVTAMWDDRFSHMK